MKSHPVLAAVAALAEKAALTGGEVFLAAMLTVGSLGADARQAGILAGVAAALTVVANGLPIVPVGLPFALDLTFRTGRTFAVGWLTLFAAGDAVDLSWSAAEAAALGAWPAAFTVAKGLLAGRLGRQGTAALLPASLDPVTPPAEWAR